ncbi:MAG: glycosyltransferase involved in cell wall biosynthesis [Halieaceae bacterium]|jgi:glycosyltransferase involved in cell wall biosynthesis
MRFLDQRGLTWRGLVTLVINNFRESGIRVTLKKAVAQLGRSDVNFDIDRYQGWFGRYNTDDCRSAASVFDSVSVVIVGALDIPQCKKYRVMQKVEFFSRRNISCTHAEYRDLNRSFSLMQLATVVIFYRLPAGLQADALIGEAKRLGLKMYYDIDDPIFDHDAYNENSNLKSLAASERNYLLAQIPSYKALMEQIGQIIVSTVGMRDLAERAVAPGTEVLVWPNLIDSATRSAFEQLPTIAQRDETAVTLGYFSGSRAHDHDLEVIAPVLSNLLQSYPQLQLCFGGYTLLPSSLVEFSSRIRVIGFMSYPAYLDNLRTTDINLVPLLMDKFNQCKSGIRYLEASLCGVPTVASRVGQFTEMITSGETGYLCSTPEQWQESLVALIEDPARRKAIGSSAQDLVNERHDLLSVEFSHLAEVASNAS